MQKLRTLRTATIAILLTPAMVGIFVAAALTRGAVVIWEETGRLL